MSCFDGFPLPPRDEDEEESDGWEDSDDADDTWRGELHFDEWPEALAGPEYWGGKGDGDLTEKYPPKDDEDEES